jgi:putative flippase GtrA
VLFSYWFNSVVVFRVALRADTLARYPLVYVVQYLASALLLGTLVEGLAIPAEFAPLIVSVLMIPVTFVMSRWIILRRNPATK